MSQIYKVEQVKKPLENYRDIDAFKIYVSDLGLLLAKKDSARRKADYAIKLSTKNFGYENGKKNVPLYAAFCI